MKPPIRVSNDLSKAKCLSFGLWLTLFIAALSGCGWLPSTYRPTSEKLIRDVTTASGYKKKIAVATMENYSIVTDQKLEEVLFQVLLNTMNSECGNAMLVTALDDGFLDIFNAPPQLENGTLDNMTLSNAGRDQGYNAIVTGALATISTRQERKGLWWFRDDHYYLQLLTFIDLLDTHNAAKLYSQPMMVEFEIDKEEANRIKSGQEISLADLNRHVEEMAEEAGTQVCDAVAEQIWKGFVVDSTADEVVLSSGSIQGIRSGNQFEVYDSSRTMDGYQGQKYYVPGPKIGEIEIYSVSSQQSKAKVLTADPIPVGSIVIPIY